MESRNARASCPVLASAALAAALLVCDGAWAQNLLSNPSFEIVGPNGPYTIFTGISSGGSAAAKDWGVFNNTYGTTITDLLPTTFPSGGNMMIRVFTDGPSNGLTNVFDDYGSGPHCTMSGAWIYVIWGKVSIGTGNGGATGPNATTTKLGEWEYLQAENGNCPANEFIIYSAWDTGGAEFFAELASVEEIDCYCREDVNHDEVVDIDDLFDVLGWWGPPGGGTAADVNCSGEVDIDDIFEVLGNWGPCP